jgi:preprotein translocase subunit SecA
MTEGVLVDVINVVWPEKGDPDAEALAGLAAEIDARFGVPLSAGEEPFVVDGKPARDRDALCRSLLDSLTAHLEGKRKRCNALAEEHAEAGYPTFDDCERSILLQLVDRLWKDHLHSMDSLREGIGLRGYAQRDPKLEYQREGFGLFEEMQTRVDHQAVEAVFRFNLPEPLSDAARRSAASPARPTGAPRNRGVVEQRSGTAPPTPGQRAEPTRKVGRNDPCPCGSGKKYKKCCGAA